MPPQIKPKPTRSPRGTKLPATGGRNKKGTKFNIKNIGGKGVTGRPQSGKSAGKVPRKKPKLFGKKWSV